MAAGLLFKFEKLPKNAKRHPTDKTLQWDMMLGKAIMKWATEQGLRGKRAITVTFTPKRKRVRPAFERWEYRLLWRALCKRIKTARDKRTKASRELLRVYVLVLANSGIRTGEANKLKVTDVHPFRDDKQRNNYRLVVRGKTGERDAIVRSVAAGPQACVPTGHCRKPLLAVAVVAGKHAFWPHSPRMVSHPLTVCPYCSTRMVTSVFVNGLAG